MGFLCIKYNNKKRAEYINIAKKYKLPIRCIVMKTDMMEAIFRNNKKTR
jgi:hypothetical protein